MVGQKARVALLGLAFLSLGVSPADAFCHGCNRWFGGAPATAYYAPAPVAVTAAYAPVAPCGTCAPACPQIVNYMPQTCYRTVYVNTPVVAYQPVTGCNPCTGCPTTVMRPVTSYVMQPRMMAYTSYRPVITAGYAPACSTCAPAPVAAAAYYTPAVAPAAPAGCCGANYAPAPAAGVVSVVPGTVVQRVIQQPSYSTQPQPVVAPPYSSDPTTPPTAPPSSAPNQTFRDEAPQNGEPQSRILQPQSSTIQPNTLGAPRALDSEDQDRTTALPLRQAWAIKPVSRVAPVTSTIRLTDESGWRTSH